MSGKILLPDARSDTRADRALPGRLIRAMVLLLGCGTSSMALAAPNACGIPAGGTVTCTPAGNPYPTGIQYAPVSDLTINLAPGVVVQTGPPFNPVNVSLTSAAPGVNGTVNSAPGTSIGQSTSPGINVQVTGAAAVDSAANIAASFFGIQAGGGTGATVHNSGTISVVADPTLSGTGISAGTTLGNVLVDNSGAITGTGGATPSTGIETFNSDPGGETRITNSGSIDETNNGHSPARGIVVNAATGATGAVIIDSSGHIGATDNVVANGILVRSDGPVQINSTGDVVLKGGSGLGISVVGSAPGSTPNGDVSINSAKISIGPVASPFVGLSGNGIAVSRNLGNVTVTSGQLTTQTGSTGGIAIDTVAGRIAVTSATLSTAGTDSTGIGTRTTSGATTIASTSLTTTGSGSSGIVATSSSGPISITSGTLVTTAPQSGGIAATAGGGAVSVISTSLSTAGATSTGISATSTSGAVTVASTDLSTTGSQSTGIAASGGAAAVTVTSSGTLSTTGSQALGVNATGSGAVGVTAGTVTTAGGSSTGIQATGATATVTAQKVTVTGSGSLGINASGTNGVTVTAGAVSSSDRAAIATTSASGPAAVSITGAVSSTSEDALRVSAGTGATVGVTAAGSLSGGRTGLAVSSGSGTAITNAGLIKGGTGYAVDASGGAATITNSGTIQGAIRLTGNADRVDNSGTISLTGTSDLGGGNDAFQNQGSLVLGGDLAFGAGTDSFTNSGTVKLASGGPATVTFDSLETFANSGLIDLRNARGGDVLNASGSAYTGSASSQLALDVDFGGASDQLRVGTAQGQTSVIVSRLGGAAPLGVGPILVQAGAASSPTAFVLAGGPISTGVVVSNLVYNPTTFAYALVGTPGAPLYRTTLYAAVPRALAFASGDAWSTEMRADRDAEIAAKRGLWLQLYGTSSQERRQGSFTAFGVTSQVDVREDQNLLGGQAGLDLAGGEGLRFGVTGGYARAHATLAGGDRLRVGAYNAGVYGALRSGGLYVQGLAKYDSLTNGDASSAGAFDVALKGHGWSATGEAGAHLGSGGWFVEPSVGLAYLDLKLDPLALPGSRVDFAGTRWLRGRAGLRAGISTTAGPHTRLTLYGGANYTQLLSGHDSSRFSQGSALLDFGDGGTRHYVEGLLGGSVGSGRVVFYAEGNGRFASGYHGWGLRSGVRMAF